MHSNEKLPEDDRLTVIAISAVAYIFQDVCHEGGHAVAGWLAGAHRIGCLPFPPDVTRDFSGRETAKP
jgi:hypothetical protein